MSYVTTSLAPIVLFVYNRPWHTQQTVKALQRNVLAQESDLFIYCDAAKNDAARQSVYEVRSYVKSIDGFKKITIIERERNWGLAASIIDGVTKIVNQHGKIIVLEDDLVTSIYFLRYMNDALEYYESEPKVMHISGWNFPVDSSGLPETVFFRGSSCWGWATWKSSWRFFEKDAQKLSNVFTKDDIYRFDYDGSAGMWSQVEANLKGLLNTWAIFWYASVFTRKGLCLHPAQSFVKNIGHDGSGVHCRSSSMYSSELADKTVTVFSDDLVEDPIFISEMKLFFKKNKISLLKKIVFKILSFLK
jgi:hypothetical protein